MNTLKLRQKGIILVVLPMCFQVLFLVSLLRLSSDADTAMKRESDSKEMIYVCSNVLQLMVDCGVYAAVYNYTHDVRVREKCAAAMQRAQQDLSAVARSVSNRDQLNGITSLQKTVAETSDVLERFLNKTTVPDRKSIDIFVGNDRLSAERKLFAVLRSKADRVVSEERERCKVFVRKKLEAKNVLTATIVVGATVDILIAFGTAMYFFSNISSRLERLTRNTRLVSERKVPLPPGEGSDEIAELDRSFHQAVSELYESEELRRQIVAMVSHDLRSPLGSIDAALTLINEGVLGDVPEPVLSVSRTASQDVARLVRLTKDLLDAESLASGKIKLELRSFYVETLLAELRDSIEYFCALHKVSLRTDDADCECFADYNRVLQILVNLVGNAIKASAPGSVVDVEASSNGDVCEFKVTDSGAGIEANQQSRIFEKFVQIQDDNRGKGVGLSICRSLVELHGGEIGVSSVPGRGSTFWFRLPNQISKPEKAKKD